MEFPYLFALFPNFFRNKSQKITGYQRKQRAGACPFDGAAVGCAVKMAVIAGLDAVFLQQPQEKDLVLSLIQKHILMQDQELKLNHSYINMFHILWIINHQFLLNMMEVLVKKMEFGQMLMQLN